MKTMALTEETVPRRTHSNIRSVVSRSRPQSLHVLAPAKRHHLARDGPVHASHHRPYITGRQHQPSNDERLLLSHLIDGSEQLPNRMASKSIVQAARCKPRHQWAALGRP